MSWPDDGVCLGGLEIVGGEGDSDVRPSITWILLYSERTLIPRIRAARVRLPPTFSSVRRIISNSTLASESPILNVADSRFDTCCASCARTAASGPPLYVAGV